MFKQRMSKVLITSILGRFMSNSHTSGASVQHTKNVFNKNEKLPALPEIERCDRDFFINVHKTIRKVKYGDIEFIECKDGYILSYIQAYMTRKEPQKAFYGVYYGRDNPLNIYGPVCGKQSIDHAKEVALLRLIETFPNIEAKKLCICNDSSRVSVTMVKIGTYSENGYRGIDGFALQNKDTYVALNRALRLKNDLQIRMLYTPTDVVQFMIEAKKLARLAAD